MPLPTEYSYNNVYYSSYSPSTIHASNNLLAGFFRRYLLQKAESVFTWTLPETWPKNYFLTALYVLGYIAVVNTDKYGVIPQWCTLRGYNVFYQPTNVIIANPLIDQQLQPQIDTQCALIRLCPDYHGIFDLVSYYADLMALASEGISMNLVNSKLAYILIAQNKSVAETLKKLYDQIASGNPAAVIDKDYINPDGTKSIDLFNNNLKTNYITDALLSDLRKIEAMFDTDVGIPNSNTDKKERLITDEVNSNNVETASKCEMWLEELKKGCNKANTLFGLSLDVNWRVDPVENGGAFDNAGQHVNRGAL